ncbi:MAG: hypothetical protein ACXVA2_23550 [Mucilaginibacter sp.]
MKNLRVIFNERKVPYLEATIEIVDKDGNKKKSIVLELFETSAADNILRQAYRAEYKTLPTPSGLTKMKVELMADAYNSKHVKVHKRFFKENGKYYIAKDRHGKRLIEMGDGVVKTTSARKINCKVCLSLISKDIKGILQEVDVKLCIKEFKELFGLSSDQTVLIVTFMINVLRVDTPSLMLLLFGMEGSGKTMLARFLISLINPNSSLINHMSGSLDDLKVYANSTDLLGYDNVSTLSTKVQDLLCILFTGGSVPCRLFFTNDELSSMYLKNSLIMTAIEIPGIRPDLAERMVTINVGAASRDRLAATKLEEKIEALRPRFLSAIVHLFSEVLTILPSIDIENPCRMADYEELGTAISQQLNYKKPFSEVYKKNLRLSAQEAIDEQPAIRLVIQLVKAETLFEGTYGELLLEIRKINKTKEPLPVTEKALSVLLRRHERAMNKLGFSISRPGRSKLGQLIKIAHYQQN